MLLKNQLLECTKKYKTLLLINPYTFTTIDCKSISKEEFEEYLKTHIPFKKIHNDITSRGILYYYNNITDLIYLTNVKGNISYIGSNFKLSCNSDNLAILKAIKLFKEDSYLWVPYCSKIFSNPASCMSSSYNYKLDRKLIRDHKDLFREEENDFIFCNHIKINKSLNHRKINNIINKIHEHYTIQEKFGGSPFNILFNFFKPVISNKKRIKISTNITIENRTYQILNYKRPFFILQNSKRNQILISKSKIFKYISNDNIKKSSSKS